MQSKIARLCLDFLVGIILVFVEEGLRPSSTHKFVLIVTLQFLINLVSPNRPIISASSR